MEDAEVTISEETVHTSPDGVVSEERLAEVWEDGVISADELAELAPPTTEPISEEPPAE